MSDHEVSALREAHRQIATLTARCEALEQDRDNLRAIVKQENKEVCEAVTDAVRWQNRYHEAMLEVARLEAASGEQELR